MAHQPVNPKKCVQLISDPELFSVETFEYWNNVEEEKNKEWWIEDSNSEKLWNYLRVTRLYEDYLAAEQIIRSLPSSNLVIADLAAGIGWASCLLSRLSNVSEVNAIEISKHRIYALFEHAIKIFSADPKKINRYLGSFYNTKFENASVDVVFMCQAFHHADNPIKLLEEVSRILKPGGLILLVGEPYVGCLSILKRFLITTIKNRKIVTNFYELFKPNDVTGDHYYKPSDYFFLASLFGLGCTSKRLPSGDVMYILRK